MNNEFEVYGQVLTGLGCHASMNDRRLSDVGTTDGTTTDNASWSSIAARAGEFLVVWQADDELPGLADNESEVYGQRLTAPLVFDDGFESGDVSQWSNSVS